MKKSKFYERKFVTPEVGPEFYIAQFGKRLDHLRTRYSPPWSEARINNYKFGWFLAVKFMQDNKMLIKKTITSPDDIDNFNLQRKDLTEEGLHFFRTTYQNYLKALDRGTNAAKSKINILDKYKSNFINE